MSWVSTEQYYRLINVEVGAVLGTEHCARLVLWQGDFADLAAMQRAGKWDQAGEYLAAGTRALVGAGAEVIAIGANTMHLVADAVSAAAGDAKLVHIVDAVRDACIAAGVTKLGLLGTQYTMESAELYPPRLAAAGIEVLVPSPTARLAIHHHTMDELTRDMVTDVARTTFRAACEELIARGAGAIALACTEHGMVLRDGDLAVPIFDSAVLHARAIVAAVLS